MRARRFLYPIAIVLLVLLGACTSGVRLLEDPAAYESEVERLHRRLLERPNDPEALRDLGVIYLRTRQYGQAQDYLQRSFSRSPGDPKTLFYLGLSTEVLGQRDTALRVYEKYPDVPRASQYRRLMQGRFHRLMRQVVQEEARRLAAMDAELVERAPTSDDIVAVFPLNYQAGEERYAALGRGLAEMVTVDLANVQSLRVVERVRLQAILDELQLGQSGAVDPASAPQVGRLLGAGRVVGGGYSVLGRRDLHVGAAIARTGSGTAGQVTSEGDLNDLFDVEKRLVFELIEALGVRLSPQEQEAIESVPTRNLQAFLAFSRGLEHEDAGRYGAAASSFQQAARLDPAFTEAGARAERAESMEAASSVEDLMVAAASFEQATGNELLQNRLQLLNATLGANVNPGPDMRMPAQEAFQPLPAPPPPPE